MSAYTITAGINKYKPTDMADTTMTSHIKKEAEAKTPPDLRGIGYECKLICDQLNEWQWQLAELQAWHFDKLNVFHTKDVSSNFRLKIRYGGAPSKLLCEIADLFLQKGIDVSLEKSWPAFDNEIWIELPSHQAIKKLGDVTELYIKLPRVLH